MQILKATEFLLQMCKTWYVDCISNHNNNENEGGREGGRQKDAQGGRKGERVGR